MKNLVSIIIPTYNRAHLIGETLDSILAQTYTNWECIIVDDGSTDNTSEVVDNFIEKDSRIQYHTRPSALPKGANACRNYGFKQSKGDFIQWFDSDDLMVENKLELKIKNIIESNSDFVISKTQNFNSLKEFPPYEYDSIHGGVSIDKYIKRKIHWYTLDVLLRRDIAVKIRFHENMHSWQDYYYFSLMLLETTNFSFIDIVLSKRRVHVGSIQDNMTHDKIVFYNQLLEAKYFTFLDIQNRISNSLKVEMVFDLMNISFYLSKERKFTKYAVAISREINKIKKSRGVLWYLIALISGLFTKKGEKFLRLAKGKSTALVQ